MLQPKPPLCTRRVSEANLEFERLTLVVGRKATGVRAFGAANKPNGTPTRQRRGGAKTANKPNETPTRRRRGGAEREVSQRSCDGRVVPFAEDIPRTDNPSGAARQLPLHSSHRPSSLSCAGIPVGLFGKPKRSTFSRFAAYEGEPKRSAAPEPPLVKGRWLGAAETEGWFRRAEVPPRRAPQSLPCVRGGVAAKL